MTEAQSPYLPDREPTEAAVCRMSLAKMRETLRTMTPRTRHDIVVQQQLQAEADAWEACLRKAGWDREPQSILDAG